jgi:hypothetical protein
MGELYDFGEVIFCVAPVFLVIFILGGALLWNSLPSRTKQKKKNEDK